MSDSVLKNKDESIVEAFWHKMRVSLIIHFVLFPWTKLNLNVIL